MNKNILLSLSIVSALILSALFASARSLSAQEADPEMGGRAVIMGDLDLEEEEGKKETPYAETQQGVINYFKHLNELAAKLEQGGPAEQLKDLDDNALRYLSAVYLYCSVNQGTCPAVLDSLLEVDVINASIRKVNTCPTLERFWKTWLKNDMERRHDYLVKVAYLQVTTDFRQRTRPKYVNCKATVTKEVSSYPASLQNFLKTRYTQGSLQRRSLEQLLLLLDKISTQIPDLFRAMGIGAPSEGDEDAAAQKPGASAQQSKGSVKKTR